MNFNKARPRVLFFQADAVASDDELAAMEKLSGAVVLPRNASVVDSNERPEDADAVAGAVPEAYEHLPVVTTYGEAKALLERRARDAKGSKKAPEATPAAGAPAKAPSTPPGWGGTQS